MKRDPEPWMRHLSQSPSMVSILQRCVLLFVFITVTSHSSAVAEKTFSSSSDRVVLAESAEAAYRRGLELVGGSTDALAAFRRSADDWRRVIAEGGNGPAAWFNLGNAELRAGKLGEAIAAYRRAERLDPIDDDIAANLAEARRRVARPIEADATDLTFANLNRWWNVISEPTRFGTAAITWTCFWCLLLWRRSRPVERRSVERESTSVIWRSIIIITAMVGILSAGTIAIDRLLPEGGTAGVLTRPNVELRTGNGLSFEPAIDEPLSEGVEFGILERRPGWWRIRLPDGTNGWIESKDGESV
jgi:hypothetical protein